MRALALAAALAAALPAPAAARPPDARAELERRREEIARALVRLGGEIQRDVLRRDVAALLARVPEEGLRCAGRIVPKARVARDLRAPGSWLHGVFFGGLGYAPPPGAPRSLLDLFERHRRIAVLVSFQRDPAAGPAGRPCLDFRTEGVPTPGAPMCFLERGGRWWFTESLYPCG